MPDDFATLSIWAPTDLADDLEAMADRWNEHRRDKKVKRSVPARESLLIGHAILDLLEDEWGTRRVERMSEREKRMLARQAVLDHLDKDE